MTNNILVSIVIPAYNTGQYIARMLNCAVAQTYKNIEIIVVNDGSTDNTLDIINSFANIDNRIKVIDIPNGGVSNARNLGIEAANGKKVFFWDSDDVVELDTIQKCLEYSSINCVNSVLYGYCNREKGKDLPAHTSILGRLSENS